MTWGHIYRNEQQLSFVRNEAAIHGEVSARDPCRKINVSGRKGEYRECHQQWYENHFAQDGNKLCCLECSFYMTNCYGVINDRRDEGEEVL